VGFNPVDQSSNSFDIGERDHDAVAITNGLHDLDDCDAEVRPVLSKVERLPILLRAFLRGCGFRFHGESFAVLRCDDVVAALSRRGRLLDGPPLRFQVRDHRVDDIVLVLPWRQQRAV
jgi:hypothetical protein